MNNLLFIADWEKDYKKTWSGTTYKLYEALIRYFNIKNININKKYPLLFISKILKVKSKLKNKSDFNYYKIKLGKEFIKESDNVPCLVFTEYMRNNCANQYIYQDLSVSYLKYLYEHENDVFNSSAFAKAEYKYLCKREELQLDFYNQCSGIFTMGEWLKKDLIDRNGIDPSKVHCVGAGINVDASLIDYSKKQGNKILFIGRDYKIKNVYLVIEAFKKAKKIKQDLMLYIIGNDDFHIKEEGIKCIGELDHNKLIDYYNLCDIYCMPSLFEGFGITFVEALIFGLPCIGRNAYEMPFLIEDGKTGYLLNNKNDSTELSELMLKALDNKEMIKNVILKKEELIKKYSWDAVAKRIYDVISNNSN